MIAYLDASSFFKAYVREDGSEAVTELLESDNRVASSRVCYAEVLSVIHRKGQAGQIAPPDIHRASKRFRSDWADVLVVEVDKLLEPHVDWIVEHHLLRGFDTVHLASACLLAEKVSAGEMEFWTADRRLRVAAGQCGFVLGPMENG